MIDEKAVETFMKSQGFERISDYYDNSGCPAPITGPTLQFYNPTTKIAVVVSAGEYNDQLILAEDYIIEIGSSCQWFGP